MARIDFKNEDLSFAISEGNGVVFIEIMAMNENEDVKNAATKIGRIQITLDEAVSLIDELKCCMKKSI
jgi:hypothetical protein